MRSVKELKKLLINNSMTKKGKDMYAQLILTQLIEYTMFILILQNILVQKKPKLSTMTVVAAVILDKSRLSKVDYLLFLYIREVIVEVSKLVNIKNIKNLNFICYIYDGTLEKIYNQ